LYLPIENAVDPLRGKWGYAMGGQILVPAIYQRAQYMQEGVGAAERDGKWDYVTPENVVLNEKGYDTAWNNPFTSWATTNAYDFSEGLVAVNRNNRWGYMDHNGVEVIPCQYDAARPVYNGMAWVKVDGLWGIADLSAYTSEWAASSAPEA
jgi:hypothetical protein